MARSTVIETVRSYLFLQHHRRPVLKSLRILAPSESPGLQFSLHCANWKHLTSNCSQIRDSHAQRLPISNLRQYSSEISSRTPDTISIFNEADIIGNHLHANGHRIWGFVVYRCTYSNDADWESCIQRIRADVRSGMDYYNGQDLLQEGHFRLTVISDSRSLDGASTQTVRRHFNVWCGRMLHKEQGSPEEIGRRKREPPFWFSDWLLPVRYNYCIQIDEDSMRSLLSTEEKRPWVYIIKADWKPRERESTRYVHGPGWIMEIPGKYKGVEGDDFYGSEDDEEYSPIEGCTDEDVGWMKVWVLGLMPGIYANLISLDIWEITYTRPPRISDG
ncbi:hypothetical protein PG991_010661 [Apiospora marii]|uniref:Uncharacterized protein n=1 Tax=Apiospora marii TaxID=335849 RepID=A0ABR1RC86_9PEZI